MDKNNLSWWNYLPQTFDGVFIDLGFFQIRYYGLMYLLAFLTTYQMMKYINKKENMGFKNSDFEGALSWGIAGVLIGGRLGYVLFYNFSHFMTSENFLKIFIPFGKNAQGEWAFTGISGMSYHGGVAGCILFASYYIRKNKLDYWKFVDLSVVSGTLAYTWGRLGNFLNNELYGRAVESEFAQKVGMWFQGTKELRHASQLYEAFSEGVLLFIILMVMRRKEILRQYTMPAYIFGYGFFRFFIEYFREPDAHIGLNEQSLSRGQILCISMMLFSLGFAYIRYRQLQKAS